MTSVFWHFVLYLTELVELARIQQWSKTKDEGFVLLLWTAVKYKQTYKLVLMWHGDVLDDVSLNRQKSKSFSHPPNVPEEQQAVRSPGRWGGCTVWSSWTGTVERAGQMDDAPWYSKERKKLIIWANSTMKSLLRRCIKWSYICLKLKTSWPITIWLSPLLAHIHT